MSNQSIPVFYEISILQPETHYMNVKIHIPEVPGDQFELKLPSWLPGAYLISDFSKTIENFSAVMMDGHPLRWSKTDKLTWSVKGKSGEAAIISYDVYAYSLADDACYTSAEYAVINPGASLMAVVPYFNEPSRLKIKMTENWARVTTGMTAVDGLDNTFQAADYHELIDCPLMAGNHLLRTFDIDGIPHDVVIEGEGNLDVDEFVEDLRKISRVEIDMMKHVPYQRYVFFLLITDIDAGLEHRNSTLIFTKRNDFKPRKKYLETITIFSHELFHAWNVKALRPKELIVPDYYSETYTDLLWFCEGFTNYYHEVFLHRAGIATCKDYLGRLAKTFHRYRMTPGRDYQSAAEGSFDAWIKYYQPNENSNNTTMSYYLKGSLIAFILDISIIEHSQGKYNLDNVMRELYVEKYVAEESGFTFDDVKMMVNKYSGQNLDALFTALVEETGDMPFEEYLQRVALKLEPVYGTKDNDQDPEGGYLGAYLRENNQKVYARIVSRNGPAYHAGMSAGDEIIGMNGYRIDGKSDLESRIGNCSPGDSVELMLSQRGKLNTVKVTLEKLPPKEYSLKPDLQAGEEEKSRFQTWCGAKFECILEKTESEETVNVG